MIAVAVSLPLTDHGFMVSAGGVAQVLAASTWAGAAVPCSAPGSAPSSATPAARSPAAVVVLVIAPPLIVQLANGTATWVPNALANVVSGVTDDTSVAAAGLAMALWALVPALIALQVVRRRDIV